MSLKQTRLILAACRYSIVCAVLACGGGAKKSGPTGADAAADVPTLAADTVGVRPDSASLEEVVDAVPEPEADAVSPACVDGDGDGRGVDCAAGPDCDDGRAVVWSSCATCFDEDADELPSSGCDAAGPVDCDDGDPAVGTVCPPTCTDTDGDVHGAGCAAGPDCDDTRPEIWSTCTGCTPISSSGTGMSTTRSWRR